MLAGVSLSVAGNASTVAGMQPTVELDQLAVAGIEPAVAGKPPVAGKRATASTRRRTVAGKDASCFRLELTQQPSVTTATTTTTTTRKRKRTMTKEPEDAVTGTRHRTKKTPPSPSHSSHSSDVLIESDRPSSPPRPATRSFSLPLSVLYQQLRAAPEEDDATIAARLARHYGLSPESEAAHALRLADIRGTRMLSILDEAIELPARRTAEAMDDYLEGLDTRIADARAYRQAHRDL